MAQARIKAEGADVLLETHGGSMRAHHARSIGRALLSSALAAQAVPRTVSLALNNRARVGRKGSHVILEASAGLMTHEMAVDLGKALLTAAMAADEHEHAERIALDSALLLRAGIPFGFSSHPKILEEARKEAAWNTDLRRHLPGGIKSQEQFGRPSVSNVPGTSPAELAAVMSARRIT